MKNYLVNLLHRQNGIAALVIIAMIATIVIFMYVNTNKKYNRIILALVTCVIWLIPSSLYYMLITNYKKKFLPKVATVCIDTMQAMVDLYGNNASNDTVKYAILDTAVETVLKDNRQSHVDISSVIQDINNSTDVININRDDAIIKKIAETKVRDLIHKH